jgi:hypothetical protein
LIDLDVEAMVRTLLKSSDLVVGLNGQALLSYGQSSREILVAWQAVDG